MGVGQPGLPKLERVWELFGGLTAARAGGRFGLFRLCLTRFRKSLLAFRLHGHERILCRPLGRIDIGTISSLRVQERGLSLHLFWSLKFLLFQQCFIVFST